MNMDLFIRGLRDIHKKIYVVLFTISIGIYRLSDCESYVFIHFSVNKWQALMLREVC